MDSTPRYFIMSDGAHVLIQRVVILDKSYWAATNTCTNYTEMISRKKAARLIIKYRTPKQITGLSTLEVLVHGR